MSPAEIVLALRAAARRSDDAALFNTAGAALHRPEYDEAVASREHAAGATPQECSEKIKLSHERALDLYEHVVVADQRAADLHREARLFEEAADLIEALQGGRSAL
jgi:hypothetical protein